MITEVIGHGNRLANARRAGIVHEQVVKVVLVGKVVSACLSATVLPSRVRVIACERWQRRVEFIQAYAGMFVALRQRLRRQVHAAQVRVRNGAAAQESSEVARKNKVAVVATGWRGVQ